LLLVRWIHALAAITWIGGILFVALVVVPVTRQIEDSALRARLIRDMGVRFRAVAWVSLGLLILTGLVSLWAYPFLLTSPRFLWKLGLVVWTLMLSALHDFVIGPRAGEPGADPAMRIRASWVARINAVVALVIVLLGLSLRD
jgi:copper resistance protein D